MLHLAPQPPGECTWRGPIRYPANPKSLEQWHSLHEAATILPPDQLEVLSLRLYHGLDLENIADLLEVTPETANRLWLRAQIGMNEYLASGRSSTNILSRGSISGE